MSDIVMDSSGVPPSSSSTAITPYQHPGAPASIQGGPLITMNADAQAIIRNQLHSFLSATQREVIALSQAQDANNTQTRLQIEYALDEILARVNADTQNNVRLSHDELYRALEARVNEGIQHIGTIRQEVEERALTVAETRVNDLVASSHQELNNQLDRVLDRRLDGDIQRALVAAKQTIEDRAVQAAESRVALLSQGAVAWLREELEIQIAKQIRTRAQKAIKDTQSTVEERAITVAENRVVAVLKETEKAAEDRLNGLITERLASGIETAIAQVNRSTEERAIAVSKNLVASAVEDTKNELDTLILSRLDGTLRARLESSLVAITSDIQAQVEERALATVKDRALANLSEHELSVNPAGISRSAVQGWINDALELRFINQPNVLSGDAGVAMRDFKDTAIQSVKRYEAAGKMIAERRCNEVIGRLESHVTKALEDVKAKALLEATSVAQAQTDSVAKRSEKALLDLHERLLREFRIQVGAANPPPPVPSMLTEEPKHTAESAEAENRTQTRESGACRGSSVTAPPVYHHSHIEDVEIKLGDLQICVRTRPTNGNSKSNVLVSSGSHQVEPTTCETCALARRFNDQLTEALLTAKSRALDKLEEALKESNDRAYAEEQAQGAHREMQARQRRAVQGRARISKPELTDAQRRRLEEIQRDLED